jgi:hypothetical protein
VRKISKNFIIIFIVFELIFSLILPSISLAVIRENMNYDKALEEVQSVYGKSEQDAKDFILKSVMNKFDLSSEAAQKIIDARDEGLTFDIRDNLDGSSQILTAFLTDEAKAKYNVTTSNPLAGSSESNQTISENKSNKLYDIDDGGTSFIKDGVGRNINETINILLAINIRCSKCYNAKCNVIK